MSIQNITLLFKIEDIISNGIKLYYKVNQLNFYTSGFSFNTPVDSEIYDNLTVFGRKIELIHKEVSRSGKTVRLSYEYVFQL